MFLKFINTEIRKNEEGQDYAYVTVASFASKEDLDDEIDNGVSHRIMNPSEAIPGRKKRGSIQTREVAPYNTNINGREVTVKKITAVIYEGESVTDVMNAQLKRNKSSVLKDGVPTVDYTPVTPKENIVVTPQPENAGA